jgi:hypothetical protein
MDTISKYKTLVVVIYSRYVAERGWDDCAIFATGAGAVIAGYWSLGTACDPNSVASHSQKKNTLGLISFNGFVNVDFIVSHGFSGSYFNCAQTMALSALRRIVRTAFFSVEINSDILQLVSKKSPVLVSDVVDSESSDTG